MKHLEDKLQIACVRWFDYQYPQYSILLHHSPNGGYRNVREAARFKSMGTRAGFPDLVLMLGRKGYNSLCIELKADKGRQSEYQKAFQENAEKNGNKYVVVREFIDFKTLIENYLEDEKS